MYSRGRAFFGPKRRCLRGLCRTGVALSGTQNPVGAGKVPAGGSRKMGKAGGDSSPGWSSLCRSRGQSLFVRADGVPTTRPDQALKVEAPDVLRTVQLMGGNSLYTLEEELKEGFITLAGGHRVGLAGECLVGRGSLLRFEAGDQYQYSHCATAQGD